MIVKEEALPEVDRLEAFREFARRRARGEVLLPLTVLPPHERRLHIRQTLREDHRFRIHNRPEGAQAKFDKLGASAFTFYRGTALLYYRDYCGTDGHLPAVFTVGDVHPENFGVMPNEDGAPFFGVNDFDEAYIAPFSWDVGRGSVGFWLMGQETGLSPKKRAKVVHSFVSGYIEGLLEFARNDREKTHELRIDNSPPMIRELLEQARTSRKKFLEKMIDLEKGSFFSTDEIVPHSAHRQEFHDAVGRYRQSLQVQIENPDRFFQVKDVAIKKDSGTASLGLERYFVLIEGPGTGPEDNVVLEFKQTRRSALCGLTPNEDEEVIADGDRIKQAHRIHLVGGDPFYGTAEMDGVSYLVRERSPFKDEIDIEDLGKKAMREYASICGRVLAQTHARSDEDTGVMEGNAEEKILASLRPQLFVEDMVRFAESAAERIYRDHELFCQDHAAGAFDFLSADGGAKGVQA